MHQKRARRIWGDLKKSVVEKGKGRLSGLAEARRICVLRVPHKMRGGADGKVIIERLWISLPYVETFNSKVIKAFVLELRSRKCFSWFLCSMYICYEHSCVSDILMMGINFYLWRTFCPHLGSFCVVSSFTSHLWPSSGDLPRPRIGMLSLVTVSPVIIAFHSCCLSYHVFDLVNLWPAWVGFETAIFWQCSPGTVETQRLYPLRRRAIKDGFFGLINPFVLLIWSSIVGFVPNL